MKTIKFNCRGNDAPAYGCSKPYGCSEPGDNTGEYVSAEVANDLHEALKNALALLEENSEQIDSEWGLGRRLDEIESDGDLNPEITQARAALAKARGEQ